MAGAKPLPAGKEIEFTATMRTAAAPEAVYDVLTDVHGHLDWAGTRAHKKFRLTGVEADAAPAEKGSEWTSTGAAPDGTFADRSIVTDATRPSRFEFTTEAHVAFRKGGEGDWTVLNHYEIEPDGAGSRVIYTQTVTRANDMGPLKVMLIPLVGSAMKMMVSGLIKPAMRNLAKVAEERAKR
jgi:uncharacterized protein YndB with AHSA1/START domain